MPARVIPSKSREPLLPDDPGNVPPTSPGPLRLDNLLLTDLLREASTLLAEEALPANCLVWCERWENMTQIRNPLDLSRLIATLPKGSYAGVKRLGSQGPWAQVSHFERRGRSASGWPFELHPHDWRLGVPDRVWKLITDDIDEVSTLVWDWVVTATPPRAHPSPTTWTYSRIGFW